MASYDSRRVAHIRRELHSHLPPEPALRIKALESLRSVFNISHTEIANLPQKASITLGLSRPPKQ